MRTKQSPLVIAIAHNKGGVGKTTTTMILGLYLRRWWRVALADYDETAHLTELVADLAPQTDPSIVSQRLWLDDDGSREADIRLIDSPPARGPRTHRALIEADYVLIPAPPERMAVRAMRQMFDTVEAVRTARRENHPFLQILGIVPTMVHQRWREHTAYLEQIAEFCAEHRIRLFPPVSERQSYLYLSIAGQDYLPVAEAIDQLMRERATPEPKLAYAAHG